MPIRADGDSTTSKKHEPGIAPITLRWDSLSDEPGSNRTGSKVLLPLKMQESQTDVEDGRLRQLLEDCEPAYLGRGGEDVFDEKYRKARALNSPQFATSFDTYSAGIIDAITRILLPSISNPNNTSRGVEASLYALNVSPLLRTFELFGDAKYTAPCGLLILDPLTWSKGLLRTIGKIPSPCRYTAISPTNWFSTGLPTHGP